MNATPLIRPHVARLSISPISISQITVRHAHIRPRWRKRGPSQQPPDQGEKIWIWDNIYSKAVFYSLEPGMNVPNAMRQMPFTAKKSKPATVRRDYWKQLCVVEFPEGRGDVGLSVYQRLREFRRRHELEWKDSLLYDRDKETGKLRTLTRVERGKKILEQKENAIADLAAVLAGAGRGSRISKAMAPEDEKAGFRNRQAETEGGPQTLAPATVHWANSIDKNYAMEWPENVTHGLLEGGKEWRLVGDKPEVTSKEATRNDGALKDAPGKE